MSSTSGKTNGLAITSLVCGILGILCVPFIPALIGVITGHLALGQIKRSGDQGRGIAIGGMVTGYLGLALGILQVVAVAAIMLPAVAIARQQADNNPIENNLRQIGMAIFLFADDHDGELPPDLAALAQENYLPAGPVYKTHNNAAAAPATPAEIAAGNCDFIYLAGGLKLKDLPEPGKVVMAHSRAGSKNLGFVMLFADGHVQHTFHESLADAKMYDGVVSAADLPRKEHEEKTPPPGDKPPGE